MPPPLVLVIARRDPPVLLSLLLSAAVQAWSRRQDHPAHCYRTAASRPGWLPRGDWKAPGSAPKDLLWLAEESHLRCRCHGHAAHSSPKSTLGECCVMG